MQPSFVRLRLCVSQWGDEFCSTKTLGMLRNRVSCVSEALASLAPALSQQSCSQFSDMFPVSNFSPSFCRFHPGKQQPKRPFNVSTVVCEKVWLEKNGGWVAAGEESGESLVEVKGYLIRWFTKKILEDIGKYIFLRQLWIGGFRGSKLFENKSNLFSRHHPSWNRRFQITLQETSPYPTKWEKGRSSSSKVPAGWHVSSPGRVVKWYIRIFVLNKPYFMGCELFTVCFVSKGQESNRNSCCC